MKKVIYFLGMYKLFEYLSAWNRRAYRYARNIYKRKFGELPEESIKNGVVHNLFE